MAVARAAPQRSRVPARGPHLPGAGPDRGSAAAARAGVVQHRGGADAHLQCGAEPGAALVQRRQGDQVVLPRVPAASQELRGEGGGHRCRKGSPVARVGASQPAHVRLLHPAEGFPRRRPELSAQPSADGARALRRRPVLCVLQAVPSAAVPRGAGKPSRFTQLCRRRHRGDHRQDPVRERRHLRAPRVGDRPRHPDRRRCVRGAVRLLRCLALASRREPDGRPQGDQPGHPRVHLRAVHQLHRGGPEGEGRLLHQARRDRLHGRVRDPARSRRPARGSRARRPGAAAGRIRGHVSP